MKRPHTRKTPATTENGRGLLVRVALVLGLVSAVLSSRSAFGALDHVPNPSPRPDVPPQTLSAPASSATVSPQTVARDAFGAQSVPAPMSARSIGSYSRGCLAGAVALPVDGPNWQAMRLSRNRNWGHPMLIAFLEQLAADGARLDGWPGLLVGDLAQPRGGPMVSGHASHQIGLDADIWLTPMPERTFTRQEREDISATSMLREGTRTIDPARFTDAHARIIRRAAMDPRVARIFVHPAIKQALCAFETGERTWLRRVRPWYGHHYHFHVRLACPQGSEGCRDQDPPPPGDGCGADLAWWLSDEPWRPADTPSRPRPPVRMSDMPAACSSVLIAR